MTLKHIANIRLHSQQIAATKFKTVKDIVGWMGVMQAQDYAMSKWAIGARLPHSKEQSIETAIDNGEIFRTHLLRPTWHLVSAEDIYWMLELTAPQIKVLMKTNDKLLELTETMYAKSNAIIKKALKHGNHLTRDALMLKLEKAKLATHNNRPAHFMVRAELDGIVCSGITKNKKTTYSLLTERVPKPKAIKKEEALKRLATKYFSSHCPATLQDFTWWSGLSITNARNALEIINPGLISEKIGAETYWLTNSFSTAENDKSSVYLLPAFDEFIISYKNRSASFPLKNQEKVFTNNGLFKPVIVQNGEVTGVWKRTFAKDKVIIETEFFRPQSLATKKLVVKEAEKFGTFLSKKVEIKHAV